MRLDDLVYRLATTLPQHRKKLLFALIGGLVAAYYYNRQTAALKEESEQKELVNGPKKGKNKRVGVNADFFQQLKRLLPVCVPGNFNVIILF